MTDQDHTNDTLPQSGRAAIYARRVVQGTRQAPYSQIDDLVAFANAQGYPPERIIVYDDVYVSGRKPLSRRGAFSDLMTAIMQEDQTPVQERIRTMYVSSEDRLFRDATVKDITLFIQACTQHGILLVTPQMTFDFQKADHVAAFRFQFQCEQAGHFIEEHIGKLTMRRSLRRRAIQKPQEE